MHLIMKNTFDFRKVLGLLAISLTLFTLSSVAQATAKPMVVKGEILDMACYMSGGMHGASHKDCAQKCLDGGSPMGLLTSDGKVYLLVENHDKPDSYASARKHGGDEMEVTGTYSERGGVQGLVVNDVK